MFCVLTQLLIIVGAAFFSNPASLTTVVDGLVTVCGILVGGNTLSKLTNKKTISEKQEETK